MKKLALAALVCILAAFSASAQKTNGTVKGVVQDSTATPISDATISVMHLPDSALVSFTVTLRNGDFEIKNLEPGNYSLITSFAGLQTLKKRFSITAETPIMDFGVLHLQRNYKLMDEVVITDDAPVKIIQDTIEFKADAFKSIKPNATVEDLLKKIPGMEVDKDGNVKSQGEQVQKVYVDGKEFFGTDPKLATKNLTQDMVESIQVYDDMSEQAKFTKIDDGSRQKAINIKLKKDKKNGLFGKASAGAGTNDRYDASLSLNRFKGNQQVSLIGAANNVNKQGFSFSDVIGGMGMSNFSGGGASFGGNGGGGGGMMMRSGGGGQALTTSSNNTGISTPLSLGLNYRDVWGSKIDVSGSLFGSQTGNIVKQDKLRQSSFSRFDPITNTKIDSTTTDESHTRNNSQNQNLRFNFRMEYRIDSMNSLLYYPSFTVQHSEGHNFDTTTTFATPAGMPAYLALTSKRTNDNSRDGFNMNQNLLFRHRFSRTGRTLTLGVTSTYNHSDGEGNTYAPYNYYRPDHSLENSQLIDQQTLQKIEGHNNTISASYTEPLGRNKLMELNYAYTNNQNTSDKKTYDYNPSSGLHDLMNTLLTNYFKNGYVSHRAGLNFRVQQKKYNYQLGMGAQTSELTSRSVRASTGKDTTVQQSFVNLYPTANFNYNFTRNKNLRFSYRGRTNQPTISQLQDVPDYSNPLQVKTGNPALKQEFANTFNLSYNTFNILSFRFFAANLNFSQTSNKIVNSIDSLTRGVTITRPVNMDGAYNSSGFLTLGFPFKNPKFRGSNINATTMVSYNRDVSMFYRQVNYTRSFLATQTIGVNYTYKEKIDLGLHGGLTYNHSKYGLQPELNSRYWTQTYSADMTFTLPKNFILNTAFDYYVNTGRATGFNQSIPMWNAYVSKLVFKNQAGEIRLAASDLLNQNQSVTRNTGDNYYEDVRSNVLQRYFLLSFTYRLNRMGGKNVMQQVPRGYRRRMDEMRITQ
jgi:hypothetical protein